MKTTMSRLAGSLSVEEFTKFVQNDFVNSEAFGTIEVLGRFSDGSVDVNGNLFLGAALSLGFRPKKVAHYGGGEQSGIIWRVNEDTLYVSDNGCGSWCVGSSNISGRQISLIREFLEANEEEAEALQERLDDLGITFS